MIPMLAIAAWSGTGKTTLLTQLIPYLRERGIRVGIIKHTHHRMDIDKPGKDSYRMREAGAVQTLLASNKRWVLMTETPEQEEVDLYAMASQMDANLLDLILVEGFKQESVPKVILFRKAAGHPESELFIDNSTLAVASDTPFTLPVPVLDLNDVAAIGTFICQWLRS